MSGSAATSTRPTLGKLGADLRWLAEKSGVQPETGAIVIIVVDCEADLGKLVRTFEAEFDASTMSRTPGRHEQIIVHGVRISVAVKEPR